ncbi:MAG: SH3 domain-containing protein [Clostridia bacterium]|nr:SH3 domain-containing protein [Clostridia bacterium]
MKAGNLMRRIVSGVLAAVLLLALAVPALAVGGSSTLAKKGDKYIVVASALNVRSSAHMSDNIIRSIKKGTKVRFRYEDSGWWYVSYPLKKATKYGFVDKQFLTRSNVPKKGTYKVTAKSLAVRSAPKTYAKKLGSLKKNAKVKVKALNGDWVRITYKGKTAWIAAKYLKK